MNSLLVRVRGLHVRGEGGEGAGKTTTLIQINNRLESLGVPVLLTREPGGTPFADQARGLLLSDISDELSALTEFLLLSSGRSDSYNRVVEPALSQGITVIGDRGWGSSMAYQVYAGGLDHEFAAHVSAFVTRGAPTDLTIVFDVPVEMGLARRHRGGQVNRIDEKSLGFHRRVRDGYLKLAEDHGFQVIDASGTPEQVEAAAWDLIFPLIAERYPDIILARQEVK